MEEDLTIKPEEYADAPQWQKDAWDSETGKAIRAGGWCMPSACAAGICKTGDNHDDACNGAGGAYAQGNWGAPLLSLPALSVRRGGIRFPRFVVVEAVVVGRTRMLWRTKWFVHVRYIEGGRPLLSVAGPFRARADAQNAKSVIDGIVTWVNDRYHAEKAS